MISSLSYKIGHRAPLVSRKLLQRVLRRVPTESSAASTLPSSSLSLQDLRSISYTPSALEQITINVPTMGDSITEGTIVEWCVSPGSTVREGDVLALVETDKVTVDIKAEQDGIMVKQLGEVEGVVEVGEGLYILDTDVENVAAAVAIEAVAAENASVSEVNDLLDAEKIVVEETPQSFARVPSIHFLGKDGWKDRLTLTDETQAVASATTVPTSNKPHAPTSITQMPYSSMYGRPPITDEEMEALILGGAEEAPEAQSVFSDDGLSGVVFVGGKIVTAGPRGVFLD